MRARGRPAECASNRARFSRDHETLGVLGICLWLFEGIVTHPGESEPSDPLACVSRWSARNRRMSPKPLPPEPGSPFAMRSHLARPECCLLYTSDAADA